MSTQKTINTQATRPTLLTRRLLWVAGALLLGALTVTLPACTRSFCIASDNAIADQDGLLEVGKADGVADLTLRLVHRYRNQTDSAALTELISQAAQLSRSSDRLSSDRFEALVAGSRSEMDAFYAQLGTQTLALRAQREQLEADLFKLLPSPTPAPASAPSPP
jgi:hypothetical protein